MVRKAKKSVAPVKKTAAKKPLSQIEESKENSITEKNMVYLRVEKFSRKKYIAAEKRKRNNVVSS